MTAMKIKIAFFMMNSYVRGHFVRWVVREQIGRDDKHSRLPLLPLASIARLMSLYLPSVSPMELPRLPVTARPFRTLAG